MEIFFGIGEYGEKNHWQTTQKNLAIKELVSRGIEWKEAVTEISLAVQDVCDGRFADDTHFLSVPVKGKKGIVHVFVYKQI